MIVVEGEDQYLRFSSDNNMCAVPPAPPHSFTHPQQKQSVQLESWMYVYLKFWSVILSYFSKRW